MYCSHWWLKAGAVLLLGITSMVRAGVRYAIEDLGTYGQVTDSSYGYALNNEGQAVGWGGAYGLLFSGGNVTLVPPIVIGNVSTDINDAGEIVGNVDAGYIYSGGIVTSTGMSAASAINNKGQVLGVLAGGAAGGGQVAALYSQGRLTPLSVPGATASWGNDLNDAGHAVGFSTLSQGGSYDTPEAAFLYDGTLHVLPTLGGDVAIAWGINDKDQVVGASTTALTRNAPVHAFIYAGGKMSDLGDIGEGLINAKINNNGQAIFWARRTTGDGFLLYSNGTLTDVRNLIEPGSGWDLLAVNDINDAGQIIGWGGNASGIFHALLLNPVPDPATPWLPAVLTISLVRRRKPS